MISWGQLSQHEVVLCGVNELSCMGIEVGGKGVSVQRDTEREGKKVLSRLGW